MRVLAWALALVTCAGLPVTGVAQPGVQPVAPAAPGALPAAPGSAASEGASSRPSIDVARDCPDPGPIAVLDGELPRWPRAVAAGQARIVAIGSSSTAGAGASASSNEYPARLATELRASLAGVDVTVVNSGRNGDEIGGMLARFEADVLAHRPDLVIWQFGSNALMRGEDRGAIERAARDGIERLRSRGIDAMLMDLQHAPRIESLPERDLMLGLIMRVSDATRTPLFRRHRLMGAWRDALGEGYGRMLSHDGLHMNDLSYACMAHVLAVSLERAARNGGRLSATPTAGR